MNERIKDLAIKARLSYVMTPDKPYIEADLEKFAELIIKECINKIEIYHIPVGNSSAGELACEWTYEALKEIRDEIKEHFGVVK